MQGMILNKEHYLNNQFVTKRVLELAHYLYYLRLKDANREKIESTKALLLWWELHLHRLGQDSVHPEISYAQFK